MENQPTNDLNESKPAKPNKKPRISTATKITAKVLTESGFSYREAASELNVSLETVQRAVKDPTLDRSIIEKVKGNLPNKLYLVAFRIADKMLADPHLLEKMNPYMCSLVMAIMVDKARLMSDQSTENIAVRGTVAEIQATLASIRETKARLTGALQHPSDGGQTTRDEAQGPTE